MLYILGIGASTPPTVIDNKTLQELSPSLQIPDAGAIKERRSIVARDVLLSTKGSSAGESLLKAAKSPTDQSLEAAHEALKNAKLEVTDIGAVIGECSTPTQTCPSEGQRLAGKLGLKLPAFDIVAGAGGFVVHLDTVRRWKKERTAKHILCSTTHTPTHAVDYRDGLAGYYFGDGSGAYIVSREVEGKLKVVDTGFSIHPGQSSQFKIELHGHLKTPENFVEEFVSSNVKECLEQLKAKYGSEFKNSFFIGPQFGPRTAREIAEAAGFAPQNILTNYEIRGDCMGASAPSILAQAWDSIKSGQKYFVVQSGIGFANGFAVLEGV